MKYQGSYCAIITPFIDGNIDKPNLKRIIEWHIEQGTKGVIPCGTTGESPTLSHDEHKEVIELAIEFSNNKLQIIAGTGSNSTEEAITLTKHAHSVGANSALVVVPYYNKPTQDGMYAHYMKIAESVDLPIFIYNIPGRSVVDMDNETIAKLALHENIIGIKDASNDLARPLELRQLVTHKYFYQLSGEDGTQLSFLANGGDGVISVTANVVPGLIAKMHGLWFKKQFQEAIEINNRLVDLNKTMFLESNPIPVKYATSRIGLCKNELRLPLTKATEMTKNSINEALDKLKVEE